ncbi:MAG: hypothetical protein Q9168_003157 [Polycauliona sp. 1 TL-2023]
MDPISILTIVGTAGKIIETCASVGYNLNKIIDQWKEAPQMLSAIGFECDTIKHTIDNIKRWLERNSWELEDEDPTFLDALSSSLIQCLHTLQRLQEDTDKVSKWQRFKRSLNNETLRECRNDLQMHVSAATRLWLTRDRLPSERMQTAGQVRLSLHVHFSERSRNASDTGSILDADTTNVIAETLRGVGVEPPRVLRKRRSEPSAPLPPTPGILHSVTSRAGPTPQGGVIRAPTDSAFSCNGYFFISLCILLVLLVPYSTWEDAVNTTAHVFDETSKQDLFSAASNGSSRIVKKLLDRGVKPSIRHQDNMTTPLHFAAASGGIKTMEILLKYKDTGWFADNDLTPLHLAARHGHINAVRQILGLSGHNWNTERAKDQDAIQKVRTATHGISDPQLEAFFQRKTYAARELAVIYGHIETALAFRYYSHGDPSYALSCACMMGNFHMVEKLWDRVSSSWFWQRSMPGYRQASWFPGPPLHLAIMSGDRATVAFLLERGLRADDQSWNTIPSMFTKAYPPYSSPAHYAAMVGSVLILEALDGKLADLTALDHRRRTPLSYAVEHLNVAAVERLVKCKYRGRSGGLFGSRATNTYLGSGHVWSDNKLEAAAISDPEIQQALQYLGFKIEGPRTLSGG